MPDFGVDFAAGCIGGAAGVIAGHPFDTVKVRLQMQNTGSPAYRGTFHCLTTIVRTEKVRGLYKGVSSPLSSVAFINAIIFGAHGSVSKSFRDQHAVTTHFLAGAAAGSAQAFLTSPMELIKLRVQLAPTQLINPSNTVKGKSVTPHTSPYQCLRHIIKEQGPKVLTRGLLATQVRDTTGIGIYFASYEYLARHLSKDGQMESLTSLQLLTAGGMAGTLSWVFNYPVDVIKTRFQAEDGYKSYMEVVHKMYAERGWRTFFVGLGATLMRAFPTNAATFFTVEWTYRILIDHNLLEQLFSSDSTSQNLLQSAPGSTDSSMPSPTQSKKSRYISAYDMWSKNSFCCLPEAGSTLLDPIIHKCRVCQIA